MFSSCPGLPHIEGFCLVQENHILKLCWVCVFLAIGALNVFKVPKLPQFFFVLFLCFLVFFGLLHSQKECSLRVFFCCLFMRTHLSEV